MLSQRFERDPAIVTRRIAAEVVLVPVRSSTAAMGAIFTLNDTAAFVWNRLDQPATIADLTAALVDEYEVDLAQAHDDVLELLTQFTEAQVIREVV